jgi:hypothetical protein
MRHKVIIQKWEESERGWGTRPDGWTMHLSEAHRVKFCEEFWARQPKGAVPDEYTRECGAPYEATVDEETYQELVAEKGSMWGEGKVPPFGMQGSDGWQSANPPASVWDRIRQR